jgi:AcrR family transcriptional regulator
MDSNHRGRAIEGGRREQILERAATVLASSGLRASLQEVAEASGILPGSLYHHFESKEDIFIALVQRYQSDLEWIARAANEELQLGSEPPLDRVVSLGTAIAQCAIEHRAALLLTYYEPPAGSSSELVRLAHQTPTTITAAVAATLEAARANGDLRTGVDLAMLTDRLYQSMLHIGIGVYHRTRGAERRPAVECRMLLHGLALSAANDARLDRSPASRVADDIVKSWQEQEERLDDKGVLIRAVARSEFASRGYELTTVRHVAAAAGLSTGTVYRLVESKAKLLASIMQSYAETVAQGWAEILTASATPVEKLDALLWFNINVTDRFAEEQRIQTAGLQHYPPRSSDLPMTFAAQLRLLKAVLADGRRDQSLQLESASLDFAAHCVFALMWTPENLVRDAGTRNALLGARDSVLRGAALRP